MPVIDIQQFREGLMANPGVYILSIRAKINPDTDLYKRRNPFYVDGRWRAHKVVVAGGTIGADYQTAMNRALVKLGMAPTFVAGPHPWGEYVDRHIVENKDRDRWYISFIQKWRRTFWFVDNQPVDPIVFDGWWKPRERQLVIYRNFMSDHILSFRWRKRTHIVTGRRPKHVYP